jgi:LysM repeat protein
MKNTIRFILAPAIFACVFVAMIAASPVSVVAASGDERMPSTTAFSTYGCSYRVRRGDLLFSIALRYNTNVYALMAMNGLSNPNLIYSGMVLSVPCPNSPPGGNPPPSNICGYHIVRPGEYLAFIAARYNTTWQAISQLNQLSNPNWIYAGMRLAIPCAGPPNGGQWKKFVSARYNYTVEYPSKWTARVITPVPSSAGASAEFVTLAFDENTLPQIEIDAMTGTPPFTGNENCARNFIFRNLPVCRISASRRQIPPTENWVFQKGDAHFLISFRSKDASSAQLFDAVMQTFQFTP